MFSMASFNFSSEVQITTSLYSGRASGMVSPSPLPPPKHHSICPLETKQLQDISGVVYNSHLVFIYVNHIFLLILCEITAWTKYFPFSLTKRPFFENMTHYGYTNIENPV
jgi:hypothetical protein